MRVNSDRPKIEGEDNGEEIPFSSTERSRRGRRAREKHWHDMNMCELYALTYARIDMVTGAALREGRGCPERLSKRGMGRDLHHCRRRVIRSMALCKKGVH